MAHTWEPIADLPSDWQRWQDQHVYGLVSLWHEQSAAFAGQAAHKQFLEKLRRQWAIETGVLERLYTLNVGTTRTLIEHGLDSALIGHEDTDKSPEYVFALIQDQHSVIEGLYQVVASERALTKSYIRELHQALTGRQATYTARNQFDQLFDAAMIHGDWKKQPNDVGLEDGSRFEFCPPEQVDSEIKRLLAFHAEHDAAGVPRDIEAAWLHHRFTLIHPFVDGNGRVARALATLVLLRGNWFPLVVTRDDKVPYLNAIRQADAGDLGPLVAQFGELQRRAIRQALSLSEEVQQEVSAYTSVLSSAKEKIAKRRKKHLEHYQRAAHMSDALLILTRDRMTDLAQEVTAVVREEKPDYHAHVTCALRNDERAGQYNRFQIVECAKQIGYFANLKVHPSWAELVIDSSAWVGVLIAFHGVGPGWYGLMGAVAMAYRKEMSGDSRLVVDVRPLCTEPFEILHSADAYYVERSFRKWMEQALIKGLEYWNETS